MAVVGDEVGIRRSVARSILVLACPVLLSGCVFGFPFGPLPQRSPTPAPSALLPSPTTLPELPDLPIDAIPDAPAFMVWAPLPNARIRISAWRAGTIATVLDVPLLNHDPVYVNYVRVMAAPTGQFVAVVEAAGGPTVSRAFVRIFSIAGRLVWTATGEVTSHTKVRWSPDGSRVALDAGRRWLVVTIHDGLASEVEIESRRPVPAGGGDYPWALLGFSEDGKTLIGSGAAGLPPGPFPVVGAPSSGGPITPLAALPTESGARLARIGRLGDLAPEAPIDPETGRVWSYSAAATSTDVAVEIQSGGKPRSFALPGSAGGSVDLIWVPGGSLLALHDAPGSKTQQLGIVSTGPDLGTERSVASIPIAGLRGRLLATTGDFALVVFGSQFLESPRRLLLVRMRDGAQTLVDADGDAATIEQFGFGGWLPSGGGAYAAATR